MYWIMRVYTLLMKFSHRANQIEHLSNGISKENERFFVFISIGTYKIENSQVGVYIVQSLVQVQCQVKKK